MHYSGLPEIFKENDFWSHPQVAKKPSYQKKKKKKEEEEGERERKKKKREKKKKEETSWQHMESRILDSNSDSIIG